MVGILIITHGEMAIGLLDAMRMIIGEPTNIVTVTLTEEDSTEELQGRIDSAFDTVDQGEGVLMMVDMLGATPFNVSAKIAMVRPNAEVITGVNLPMLLETAMQREFCTFEELIPIAKEAGAGSVKVLSESIGGLKT